ncbi:lysin [Rhodococcus phage REQ1]|uniref:endolysin n=1 Tax=Rhodococcus phage REQ1 TaxID=1109712 RepID=UPI00023EEC75|nr:endolysin [Rhodococcus phage REQ1]AEV52079.1 lysin [Rhodococcus phage REQ1]
MQEIDQTNISKNSSGRYGGRIRLFVIHTQEGNGTARSLAGYLQNPSSGVSYHYSIDNTECIAVVDTDRSAWAVLDANGYTINLCYAGSRASMSRDEWIAKYSNAIDFTGWLIARDAKQYGFTPYVIGHPEIRAGKQGTTDHYGITKGLGIGDHTDVGGGYPWDLLRKAIDKYMGNTAPLPPAPLPIVNPIDECRKANDWLGDALDGQKPCPDKKGQFRYFKNGAVYWTPETGARAIPSELLKKFADLKWETGPLGYPTNDRTILNGPNGRPWGVVQGFNGGNLYRKYGTDEAFWTHGEIGNRWARSGFENGPLGWPLSDELPFDGGVVQYFENGQIHWPGKLKTIALLTKDGADTPLADQGK